jgi:hypothetical protein
VDVSGATEFDFTDDMTMCNKKPVVFVGRTFSKASSVTSTTAATGVDVSGATEFDFKDDMTTCNKKPVAFVGWRGKKTIVSKSPSKVAQVKEAAAVEAVDLKHHVEKIKAVETVTPLPPPDFKVVETVKAVDTVKLLPRPDFKVVETVEVLDMKPPPPDFKAVEYVEALETKSPPPDLVETVKAVEAVEALETKSTPPEMKTHVKVADDRTDSSVLDLLPDDDVSVEFSRVAAKQSPTIDPVLFVYPFVGGKALENATEGLVFGKEVVHLSEPCLLQIQKKNTHPKACYMTVRNKISICYNQEILSMM